MRKINIINKCTFLLESITVMIGGEEVNVKRGGRKTVELPEGEYKVKVVYYWNSGTIDIVVGDNDINLIITRSVPEYFYAGLMGAFILLATLQIFSVIDLGSFFIIGMKIPPILPLLAVLSLTYIPFFGAKKYFRISDHYGKNQHRQ